MAVERIARLVLPQEGASMTTGVAVGSIDLLLGHPGVGVDLATSVLELLADIDAAALRSRAGFAYATRTGVDELLSPLAGNDHWSSTTKRWLIGVHHAISEPSGLEVLASLSNSQVRLATCGESLRDAIRGRKVFHAKVFAVDTIKGDRLRIITGSANLTAAALSARSRNYEAALKVQSTLRPSATSRFIDWWDAAWREALIVNVANLDMYARLRETFIEDNQIYWLDGQKRR